MVPCASHSVYHSGRSVQEMEQILYSSQEQCSNNNALDLREPHSLKPGMVDEGLCTKELQLYTS